MNRPAASTRERRSGRLSEFEQVSIIHQTIDERYEMNDAPLPMTLPTAMASHPDDTDEFSSCDDFLNTMSLRKVLMEHDFYCKSKRSSRHKTSSSDLDLSPPPSSGSGKGKVLVGKKPRDELDNSHHDTRRKSYASLSMPSSPGNNSGSSSCSSSDDLDTSHHQRRPYHGPQF
jgi:hypothetical protein